MPENKLGSIPLFDIDLTLLKSGKGDIDFYDSAIQRVFGITASVREIQQPNGMTAAQIISEVLKIHSIPEVIILSRMKEVISAFEESFFRDEPSDITAMPGAHELLTALQNRDFPLGLLTGNIEAVGKRKLQKVGLDHFFRFGAFGNTTLRRSELIEIARSSADKTLGVSIPSSRLVLMGDSPLDIEAAKEGKIRSIGVGAGVYSADHLKSAGADLVVQSLNDREAILNFLSKS